MFKLQGSKEVDDFAAGLAREFCNRFPPGTDAGEGSRLARAVDDICNRARAFQREKQLGIYGRAKVGTAFKMEMKTAGYPDAFVDDLTRQLLLSMSGR